MRSLPTYIGIIACLVITSCKKDIEEEVPDEFTLSGVVYKDCSGEVLNKPIYLYKYNNVFGQFNQIWLTKIEPAISSAIPDKNGRFSFTYKGLGEGYNSPELKIETDSFNLASFPVNTSLNNIKLYYFSSRIVNTSLSVGIPTSFRDTLVYNFYDTLIGPFTEQLIESEIMSSRFYEYDKNYPLVEYYYYYQKIGDWGKKHPWSGEYILSAGKALLERCGEPFDHVIEINE